MHPTQWLVLLFVVAVLAGVGYQLYLAGHLMLLAVGLPLALLIGYGLHRMENRR